MKNDQFESSSSAHHAIVSSFGHSRHFLRAKRSFDASRSSSRGFSSREEYFVDVWPKCSVHAASEMDCFVCPTLF